MNTTAQRVCAWCGPGMVLVCFFAFLLLARFIPPSPPDAPPAETLAMYTERGSLIRVGLVLGLFASALLIPWSAAMAAQMSRIEGARNVLAMTFWLPAVVYTIWMCLLTWLLLRAVGRPDPRSAGDSLAGSPAVPTIAS